MRGPRDDAKAAAKAFERATWLQRERPEQALAQFSRALETARTLAERDRDDFRHVRMVAAVLYAMAGCLGSLGQQDDAIAALAECSAIYADEVRQGRSDAMALLVDVSVREGLTYRAVGRGITAVTYLDAAVTAYRSLLGREGAERQVDLARVLAQNAVVLMQWGDPDVAVVSADHAIRYYLGNARKINLSPDADLHGGLLLSAVEVASKLHGEYGRLDLALQADLIGAEAVDKQTASGMKRDAAVLARIATRRGLHQAAAGRTEAPASLAAGSALHREEALAATREWEKAQSGTVRPTLATALRAARVEPGRIPAGLIQPADSGKIVSPSARCDDDPERAADAARLLATVAEELMASHPDEGLRAGLEAHYLFAGLTPALPRRPLPTPFRNGRDALRDGVPWARALVACARALPPDPAGRAMALDLADWAGNVAESLIPFRDSHDLAGLIAECAGLSRTLNGHHGN